MSSNSDLLYKHFASCLDVDDNYCGIVQGTMKNDKFGWNIPVGSPVYFYLNTKGSKLYIKYINVEEIKSQQYQDWVNEYGDDVSWWEEIEDDGYAGTISIMKYINVYTSDEPENITSQLTKPCRD